MADQAVCKIAWADATDVGLVREQNEDCHVVLPFRPLTARLDELAFGAIVADGMGGHAAGEIASRMAVDQLAAAIQAFDSAEDRSAFCSAALQRVHSSILDYGRSHRGCGGMGTTLSALWARLGTWLFVHVGDSRIYRLRADGSFAVVTTDHSVVGDLVRRGALSPEQARWHPRRSMLTQAVGVDAIVPETGEFTVTPGERLLLCSDGLWDEVEDDVIRSIMAAEPDCTAVVCALLKAALAGGGRDNVTVIVLEIQELQ